MVRLWWSPVSCKITKTVADRNPYSDQVATQGCATGGWSWSIWSPRIWWLIDWFYVMKIDFIILQSRNLNFATSAGAMNRFAPTKVAKFKLRDCRSSPLPLHKQKWQTLLQFLIFSYFVYFRKDPNCIVWSTPHYTRSLTLLNISVVSVRLASPGILVQVQCSIITRCCSAAVKVGYNQKMFPSLLSLLTTNYIIAVRKK